MSKHRRGKPLERKWVSAVQRTVNHVVKGFYDSEPSQRTGLRVLELIEENWTALPSFFESHFRYYEVLLKTTDHLLQGLLPNRDHPSIVMEKEKEHLSEPVMVWNSKTCLLRTYQVEIPCDVKDLQQVQCFDICETLPDVLEVFHVLSGRTTQIPLKHHSPRKCIV